MNSIWYSVVVMLLAAGVELPGYAQSDSLLSAKSTAFALPLLVSQNPPSMATDFYNPLESFRQALLRHIEYPNQALHMGLEGTVVVRIELGADNQIGHIRIVRSAGKWFDQAVLRAISQVNQQRPARISGVPIAHVVDYPVMFRQ